jgi:hypothetical protein
MNGPVNVKLLLCIHSSVRTWHVIETADYSFLVPAFIVHNNITALWYVTYVFGKVVLRNKSEEFRFLFLGLCFVVMCFYSAVIHFL